MNPNARKNLIYSIVLLLMVLVVYFFRSLSSPSGTSQYSSNENGLITLSGEFLSQSYLILFHGEVAINKSSIDSILNSFSQKVNPNSSSSELYQLNQRDTLLNPSQDLIKLLQTAQKDHQDSKNVWDPSMAPLQKIWTFSASGAKLQDSVNVGAILSSVGLSKIILTDTLIRKTTSGLTLDLADYGSAIALEEIASFLEKKGVQNYFMQMGRHTLAKGVNEKQELWKTKINYPGDSLGAKKEGLIALMDRSVSVSGDFSTYYTQDSVKRAFRLDPRTGYPVTHGLLAVSVLAKSAKSAGVLSEALMVQGWKEAISLDSLNDQVEMILIYNEKGAGIQLYASPELRKYLSFPVK